MSEDASVGDCEMVRAKYVSGSEGPFLIILPSSWKGICLLGVEKETVHKRNEYR